jgi:ABC-type branched-subunit amino acid transport system ATPase component/ABC-type branched-subunit amino acid transport system permease subunit
MSLEGSRAPAAVLGPDRPSWQVGLLFVCIAGAAPFLARVFPGPLNGYHALVLCFGVTYVMAALPLNLLMGYAGQISLGHAAFLGIGAFASGIVAGRLGLPFVLGVLTAMATGGIAALVIGLPALRIRGLYLALVTLGFGLAMYSFVFRSRAITGGYAGVVVPRPKVGSFVFTNNADLLAIVISLLAVVWIVDRNIMRTKVGRAFLALRSDESVASVFGIDVPRYKTFAFGLYGALSGAAGAVLGHVIGLAQQETFTFDVSLLFVVIVLVGGLSSRPGVALAAFAFGISPRLLVGLHEWVLIAGPAAVLLILVRYPRGIGGVVGDKSRPLTRHHTGGGGGDYARQVALPRPLAGAAQRAVRPLVVCDLVVRFGGLVAVDGVSLEVEHNTITGLIGPNGAGKTTLFNAVSGLVPAQQGQIDVGGVDVSGLPPHRRAVAGIGRTFQQVGLIKDLSVAENFLLAQHRFATYHPLSSLAFLPNVQRSERALRERAAEAIALLGLEPRADTTLGELSHGQQRLVEIAAALLTSPGVLLLDEPSAGMSPAAAEALAERLVEMRDQIGQTIFLIEHHLPLVMATCDRVHVMDSGHLLATGTPAAVRSNPKVAAAYLGARG